MLKSNELNAGVQQEALSTDQVMRSYLDSLKPSKPLPTELDANSAFELLYEKYPGHRRPDINIAKAAWDAAALSDEEARALLEWLIDIQVTQLSWHPLAQGMYVPYLVKFLKKRWWLTPKANRYQ
ncbi:hypothetical protein [Vibrio parahaemolyticus]